MVFIAILIASLASLTHQQGEQSSSNLARNGLFFVQPSSSRFFTPSGLVPPRFRPSGYHPHLIGSSELNSRDQNHVPGEGVFLRPPSPKRLGRPANSTRSGDNSLAPSSFNRSESVASPQTLSSQSSRNPINTGRNPSEDNVKPKKSLIPFFNNATDAANASGTHDKNETPLDSEVCYPPLGCFGKLDFFDLTEKPINFLPQSPQALNVTFLLFTSDNPFDAYPLKFNSPSERIRNSPFDPRRKTKFIIHGWTQSFDQNDWMGEMKDLILRDQPNTYNVFGVDWANGAKKINYFQSVANTRVVGAETAFFIEQLAKHKGLRYSDVHIIGHSLGGQVAGYAGERLRDPQIGRITGLDPAGPSFYPNNSALRLDISDAFYVEVLHTDAGNRLVEGLGLDDAIGDIDFYPNGGSKQPSCGVTKGLFNVLKSGVVDGIANTGTCNHFQATVLMRVNPEELTENCQFVGYECRNYDDFVKGLCTDCGPDNKKCAVLTIWGETDRTSGMEFVDQKRRERTPRRFYYKTKAEKPFCLHHYAIIVHLSDRSESGTGKFTMNLIGEKRRADDIQASESLIEYKPGESYPYLITRDKSMGRIRSASLRWTFGGIQTLNPLKLFKKPRIVIDRLEVRYMSNIDPEIRNSESSILCPSESMAADSGETLQFVPCQSGEVPSSSGVERPNLIGPDGDRNSGQQGGSHHLGSQNGSLRPDHRPTQGYEHGQNVNSGHSSRPNERGHGMEPHRGSYETGNNRGSHPQDRTRPHQNGHNTGYNQNNNGGQHQAGYEANRAHERGPNMPNHRPYEHGSHNTGSNHNVNERGPSMPNHRPYEHSSHNAGSHHGVHESGRNRNQTHRPDSHDRNSVRPQENVNNHGHSFNDRTHSTHSEIRPHDHRVRPDNGPQDTRVQGPNHNARPTGGYEGQ